MEDLPMTRGMARIGDLQVNEDQWGEGAEPIVHAWLAANYDPLTMPPLRAVDDREGAKASGCWAGRATAHGLLATIFGDEYMERQLAQVNADLTVSKRLAEARTASTVLDTPTGRSSQMADLIHDLQHHASDKYEIAAAIALCFASILNPEGWQVYHYGKGNNSWRMWHPVTKKTWFFTGYEKGKVLARDSYRWEQANRVTLASRLDVIRWAKKVKP